MRNELSIIKIINVKNIDKSIKQNVGVILAKLDIIK